jgi:hypothetical protein
VFDRSAERRLVTDKFVNELAEWGTKRLSCLLPGSGMHPSTILP